MRFAFLPRQSFLLQWWIDRGSYEKYRLASPHLFPEKYHNPTAYQVVAAFGSCSTKSWASMNNEDRSRWIWCIHARCRGRAEGWFGIRLRILHVSVLLLEIRWWELTLTWPYSNLPICTEHITRPLDLLGHHNCRQVHNGWLALYELEQFREREYPIRQLRRDDLKRGLTFFNLVL